MGHTPVYEYMPELKQVLTALLTDRRLCLSSWQATAPHGISNSSVLIDMRMGEGSQLADNREKLGTTAVG